MSLSFILTLVPSFQKIPDLYVLPSKDITNRYIYVPLSALLKTSLSFSSGEIFINSFMSSMNISTYGNISASSTSLIDVIDYSSFSLSTSGVDISDSASVSLSGSLL